MPLHNWSFRSLIVAFVAFFVTAALFILNGFLLYFHSSWQDDRMVYVAAATFTIMVLATALCIVLWITGYLICWWVCIAARADKRHKKEIAENSKGKLCTS